MYQKFYDNFDVDLYQDIFLYLTYTYFTLLTYTYTYSILYLLYFVSDRIGLKKNFELIRKLTIKICLQSHL